MLVPSKFTRIEESTVFKMLAILSDIQPDETVGEALVRTRLDFLDASEFLLAMDVLFFLGYLDVWEETGVIEFA